MSYLPTNLIDKTALRMDLISARQEALADNIANMDLINPMLENSTFQDTFKSISDKYIYNETTLDDAASELHRELVRLAG